MSHTIRIAQTDLHFPCAPGQTVLDAALAAGIELPHSCRKGVCANCAGRVDEGLVEGLGGAPLHHEACDPDQVLLCLCVARSDLVISPTRYRRVDPAAAKTFVAKVYKHQMVASDVSLLQLRLPAGQRLKFRAGQYLQVILDDGSRRSYSMANPPHENDGVTLHIRHVPGGRFSALLPTLQPGDTVRIEGPHGSFGLREDSQAPLVFVAGGTGFAPIKSILDDMVKRGDSQRPVTLLWGGRRPEHLYLGTAVQRWQRLLPGLQFVPAVSEPAADTPPEVFRGDVHQALLGRFTSLAGHELYACGAPALVMALKQTAVQRLGLAPQDFFSDAFVSGPVAAQGQSALAAA